MPRVDREYHPCKRCGNPQEVKKHCRTCQVSLRICRQFKITYEQYISLGDTCNICGRTGLKGRHKHLDHDHETNEIRGILCRRCNVGIAMFLESPKLMKLAIKYLKRGPHQWN